jgi:hypothetical protein
MHVQRDQRMPCTQHLDDVPDPARDRLAAAAGVQVSVDLARISPADEVNAADSLSRILAFWSSSWPARVSSKLRFVRRNSFVSSRSSTGHTCALAAD